MSSDYWATIDAQLTELRTAKTAADALRILAVDRNPAGPEVADDAADGFFAGSGGDDTVREALLDAGWTPVWTKASYYYAMRAPDGSVITYIEGDLYRGDHGATA